MAYLNFFKRIAPRQWVMIICVAIFLYFVYPTPYYYIRVDKDLSRVNRFTGVEEIPTDSGWRTNKQNDEEREAKNKILQSHIALIFKEVTSNDVRNDYERLLLNNPTLWQFDVYDGDSIRYKDNIVIEYFRVHANGDSSFLFKNEVRGVLKSNSYTDINLGTEQVQDSINQFVKGTKIIQKVTITFSAATNDGDKVEERRVFLFPPLTLVVKRDFISP